MHEGIGVKNAVEELLPREIQRPPSGEDTYEPEKFLEVINTSKGLGVWAVTKQWYYHLK